MKKLLLPSFLLLLFSFYISRVVAQPPPTDSTIRTGTAAPPLNKEPDYCDFSRRTGLSFYMDQDYFNDWLKLAPNEDRNYTMGMGLVITGNFTAHPLFLTQLPLFAEQHIMSACSTFSQYHFHSSSFSFGVTAFTPEKLDTTGVLTNDRPYSSIMYFKSSRSYLHSKSRMAIVNAFSMGILGLNVARDVQTSIHRKRLLTNPNGRPLPVGWHNQISNGGEVTAMCTHKFYYNILGTQPCFRIKPTDLSEESWLQISTSVEANLGYYTNLGGGLHLKIGKVRTAFFEEDNAGVSQSHLLQTPGQKFCTRFKKLNWGLYLFMNARGYVWGYNALLMGQLKRNPYELTYSQIQPVTGNFDVGVRLDLWPLTVSFIPLTARTPEFKHGLKRWHYWGTLVVGISM